jgi:general secretion pathway protein L
MRTLVIILDVDGSERWGLFTNGHLAQHGEGLASIPTEVRGQGSREPGSTRVWLVVPGQDVLLRAVRPPPGVEKDEQTALAFLLEDDLATPPEQANFALGQGEIGAVRIAAAVAQEAMTAWLEKCRTHGLEPDVVAPSSLAVPAIAGTISMTVSGHSAIVMPPDGIGLSLDLLMTAPLIKRLILDARADKMIVRGPVDWVDTIRESARDITVESAAPPAADELLKLMYVRLAADLRVNLRQGRFAAPRNWAQAFRPWLRAAVLATVFIGISAVAALISGWQFTRDAERALASAERIARDVLPPGTRVINGRAQLKAYAAELRAESTDSFLTLSEALAASLNELASGSVEHIQYDRAQQTLSASVALPSYEAMTDLKAKVTARKVLVEDGQARQRGNAIVADLRMRTP